MELRAASWGSRGCIASGEGTPGFSASPFAHQVCDLGHIPSLTWVSVSSLALEIRALQIVWLMVH